MIARQFRIRFVSAKNSFCYFSADHIGEIEHGNCLEAVHRSKKFYFTVGDFLAVLKKDEIGINTKYAYLLGLSENDNVIVSQLPFVSNVIRCELIPDTEEDFEIIETVGDIIQEILLNQLIIVFDSHKYIIWVTNSLNVQITLDSIKPSRPGLPGCLAPFTEIEVLKPKKQTKISTNIFSNMDALKDFFRGPKRITDYDILLKCNCFGNKYMFRVENVSTLVNQDGCYSDIINNPFNAIVDSRHIQKGECRYLLFELHKLNPPSEHRSPEKSNSVYLTVQNLEGFRCPFGFPVIYLHQSVLNHLNLQVTECCVVEQIEEVDAAVNSLQILTSAIHICIAEDKFKLFLNTHCANGRKIVLNSDVAFDVARDLQCKLLFQAKQQFLILDSDFARTTKFVVKEHQFIKLVSAEIQETKEDIICKHVPSLQIIITNVCNDMGNKLARKSSKPENYIFKGKSGSGKTSLIDAISVELQSSQYRIHFEYIPCNTLKGKTVDSLQKLLTAIFRKLIYYQPSILVLDDLHIVCETVQSLDSTSQEAVLHDKISDVFVDFLGKFQSHNIAVIASTISAYKLNKKILTSKGRCYFRNVIDLPSLSIEDRVVLFKIFTQQHLPLGNLDFDVIHKKTDGFSMQDLSDFANKVVFEAFKAGNNEINMDHLNIACSKFTALSIKDVELNSPGKRNFSDIGGLQDVKDKILECVYWPIKYSDIFKHSPLRLQTGILLYGAPGTGKTILAGAVAKECGLRLISVSGPELLSKYIGASEQSVRDVFERAQSAKPCILFFDEFDSLAPRRGHDSTGVTDRVVNQFLTQLDGVEGLDGVFIIAATSRPDLLDPALLRPGRLDKLLCCKLPDHNDRLSILTALSKGITLTSNVNLNDIASATAGFTGADLQAVLYTAQLDSIHDSGLESESFENRSITQDQIKKAIDSTNPSLSQKEKLKYDMIYRKFENSDLDLAQLQGARKKVSLA